jgi:hypothetical protein
VIRAAQILPRGCVMGWMSGCILYQNAPTRVEPWSFSIGLMSFTPNIPYGYVLGEAFLFAYFDKIIQEVLL